MAHVPIRAGPWVREEGRHPQRSANVDLPSRPISSEDRGMRNAWTAAFLPLPCLVLMAPGCLSAPSRCTPGETQTCPCAGGGTGIQECESDGTWSSCRSCVPSSSGCTPGNDRACGCAGGGEGVQFCDSDGSWGACLSCGSSGTDAGSGVTTCTRTWEGCNGDRCGPPFRCYPDGEIRLDPEGAGGVTCGGPADCEHCDTPWNALPCGTYTWEVGECHCVD